MSNEEQFAKTWEIDNEGRILYHAEDCKSVFCPICAEKAVDPLSSVSFGTDCIA